MVEEKSREDYTIVLCSDIHCGDGRFDHNLITQAIKEINQIKPNLIIVAGDLSANGYRDEFEEAKKYISRLHCPQIVVIAGNHDCRNVGYLHFEDLFGSRYKVVKLNFKLSYHGVTQEHIKVVAVDSNKPDLNDGEVGRQRYDWILKAFPEEHQFKIFVLHHHLISVPGTGRERNIVWDAGDVLATLDKAGVDLVLCGHKHVPYIWTIKDMIIVNSGTIATRRTRGYSPPAYNIINIDCQSVTVITQSPGEGIINSEIFPRLRYPKQ